MTACDLCGGYGSRHDPIQHGWEAEPCDRCGGDGGNWPEYPDDPCPECGAR